MKSTRPWIAITLLATALTLPVCAQRVYPNYGPPVPISSGDQNRRQAEAQPTVEASSGQLAPAQPVDSVSVDYANVDGKTVTGFLAFPAANHASLPGLLLFPEWWGLNRAVRGQAERLAGQGYTVLAIDPFHGRIAASPQAARQLKHQALSDPAALDENIRQAYTYLKTRLHTLKIGAVGRDFGGDLVLRATQTSAGRLRATVVWSACFKTGSDKPENKNTPILILSGDADPICLATAARAFATAQQSRGATVQMHLYPGVGHAFANPAGKSYDAAAAGDAWRRTKAFLAAQLKH